MKVEITLRNGVQLTVDVEELTSRRSRLTGKLEHLQWTAPEGSRSRLHYIDVREVVAIVVRADEETR